MMFKRCLVVLICVMGCSMMAYAQKSGSLSDDPVGGDQQVDPEISAALLSPPDPYGIPIELYSFDRSLRSHRGSLHRAETTAGVLGIVGGVTLAGGVALGLLVPDLVWAPQDIPTPIPYGYFLAALGGVVVVVDLVAIIPGIDRKKKALVRLYEETYTEQ